MRSILLPLAMLAVCAAAPVAVAAPLPAAPPATAASSHGSFFIQDVNPDDILSYDGSMCVVDASMRLAAAAPLLVTTVVTTTPPVDLDSDGSPAGVDCNDANNSIYPGAPESIADGVDQDCDGFDACYEDQDHDGFGSDVVIDGTDCHALGYAPGAGDCLDVGTVTGTAGAINAVDIHPNAIEACDLVDNDCDGLIDDLDPDHQGQDFYVDGDGDGYGAGAATFACVAPDGSVSDNTDCDDANNAMNPGATEIPDNTLDDNCDNLVDNVSLEDTDTIGTGDTDNVLDTSDRGAGTDKGTGKGSCGCDSSSGASPAGLALALSFVGGLLARRRKV